MSRPRLPYQKKFIPKRSCIHYMAEGGTESVRQRTGGIRCRLTTYAECIPEACPWYMSDEMLDASYEKARQNYIKQYGRDNYSRLGYDKYLKRKKAEEVTFDADE
jgi:hypothetical protein